MPVNPYFNFVNRTSEQNLVESLIIEAIKIYGHTSYYIPRESANLDTLFGEDDLSHFDSAYEIEIYLKNSMSFGGSSEVFSKFGLTIEDQATFVVAVKRFNEELGTRLVRPRENDIIYIQFTPDNRYLFEIRFVENKEQLFQLGKLYTYELRCEMMNYSQERFNTGVAEADAVAENQAFTLSLPLGTGSGTYQVGESVYQGTAFINATATGTVFAWDGTSKILRVQNITGAFNDTANVVGVTSAASYAPTAAPSLEPNDPLSDNASLDSQAPSIVLPRDNPRYR